MDTGRPEWEEVKHKAGQLLGPFSIFAVTGVGIVREVEIVRAFRTMDPKRKCSTSTTQDPHPPGVIHGGLPGYFDAMMVGFNAKEVDGKSGPSCVFDSDQATASSPLLCRTIFISFS